MNDLNERIVNPRLAQRRTVSVVGTGAYLPERVLSNAELERMVDTSDEWIVTRTGMRERRIAAPDQYTSDLGAEAARRALEQAGVTPEDVDMLVVATISPDMGFPNTGCFIQNKLGAKKAFCMDVEAACSGSLYALAICEQFVATGQVETALAIGAEKLSSITDWEDRNTCVLFGDGAGAAVLQARNDRYGILSTVLGSDGALGELLMLPGGGSRHPASEETIKQRLHYMKMTGREVFKHAVTKMTAAAREALNRCGLTIDDIACVVPHQANLRIIEAIGDRLGGGRDKYFVNVDRYGNTSAASVYIALHEAAASGRIRKGDFVLSIAFGGGFTWGATVLEWTR